MLKVGYERPQAIIGSRVLQWPTQVHLNIDGVIVHLLTRGCTSICCQIQEQI
jgi:hypothetical protein